MNKAYIVYQDGTYFSTDVLGNITCTKNPLQALMFDSYEAALALRNKKVNGLLFLHIFIVLFLK